MSDQSIAAYSFLPWARQGLGNEISDTPDGLRASIDITLQLIGELIAGGSTTETLPRKVALYGPGDVIGIDSASIVRTEPRNWITNFESNYMPFVEFYEEDFCWRYTPAKASPDTRRLRPWLALVVLEESEFAERGTIPGRPLPVIEVATAAQVFPPPDDLWAWAHVHVNGKLGGNAGDPSDMAARLAATVASDRDQAYSRLMCPRILKPNTAYHAFVIPAFESGRLAGIGKNPVPGASTPTQSAWAEGRTDGDKNLYPVYHRWQFRTGTVGDFEYLVRLLKPRTVDPRVGRRPMDVLDPRANLPAIPELGGILRLGGALRAPLSTLSAEDLAEHEQFEEWGKPYPHDFQEALAALVNLAAEYGVQPADVANDATAIAGVVGDEDPLIVPPLYGRWHSITSRLTDTEADPAQKRWVNELNLDPRHRVAAGLGTGIVQQNQEAYMEAAWQQVGKVLEGNARIRFGQMALFASRVWHRRELAPLRDLHPERLLSLTAPVQRRVLQQGLTIGHRVQQSAVPPALIGKAFRQAVRPGGRAARLVGFTVARPAASLLARVNAGEVSGAPPKVVAPGLPKGKDLAGKISSAARMPEVVRRILERPWLAWVLLLVGVVLAMLMAILVPGVGPILGAALLLAVIALLRWLIRKMGEAGAAGTLDTDARTPEAVDDLPAAPGFTTAGPGEAPPRPGSKDGADSPEAVRFKEALRNTYAVDAAERKIEKKVRRPLDLRAVAGAAVAGINPKVTVPKRVLGSIEIPERIAGQLVEDFGEVMVYPEIDTPMYEPLKNRSSEFFLPNIQLLSNNSITLLETNQKFIESYMVGLNHEFARELLWREYPTDQRGSYFRQFWDVTGFLAEPGADPEAQRERLRDIPELHRWSVSTGLGEHDHREQQGDKEEEVVLAIRGELLKKYPTAVVYAHRAEWETLADGKPDRTRPRKLADLPAGEPPRTLVKTPLYEAKVDPDIYFFGFDLTAEKAKGERADAPDDPGWFFVLKERPGEPRFGLDLPQDGPQAGINTWNELSWADVVAAYSPGAFLKVGERSVSVTAQGAGPEEMPQHNEDKKHHWRPDTNAAELAYILYQVPVLMGVHATEMLQKGA